MNHWNDASDFRTTGQSSSSANGGSRYAGRGRDFFGRACSGEQNFDRWVERTRLYLKSRTADHWMMFIAGLVLGALLM